MRIHNISLEIFDMFLKNFEIFRKIFLITPKKYFLSELKKSWNITSMQKIVSFRLVRFSERFRHSAARQVQICVFVNVFLRNLQIWEHMILTSELLCCPKPNPLPEIYQRNNDLYASNLIKSRNEHFFKITFLKSHCAQRGF